MESGKVVDEKGSWESVQLARSIPDIAIRAEREGLGDVPFGM